MIVTPDNIVGTVCAVMLAVAFGYRVIMDRREESLLQVDSSACQSEV